MDIVSTSIYVGPNVYAKCPIIRLRIDFGRLADDDSTSLGRDFASSLCDNLPGIDKQSMAKGGRTLGQALADQEKISLAELLAHVALYVQVNAGCDLNFASGQMLKDSDEGDVCYAYETEDVGLEAGDLALDILDQLVKLVRSDNRDDVAEKFDFPHEIARFIRFCQRRALGPSTASLIKAAKDRGIPFLRLNSDSLVQLGHGRYQRRIEATTTSQTSLIAAEIASDKELTHKILSDLGLPVPKQKLAYTAEEAVRAANRIGYPVVVKPVDGNHGRGVSIGLVTPDEVDTAFEKALEHSDGVVVESMIRGQDHRLVVVDGRLVAAARRMPGHVVGNGRDDIKTLVEEVNKDPRRGVGHEKELTKIDIDDQAKTLLADAGLTLESVPGEGQIVYLRRTANLSTGGTAIDVTDEIHPDNREMAERAIRAIGLDVGGVDFLTTDISKSYRETNGAICEINAAPGFRMHVAPTVGKPRDVAGAVIDMLFPADRPKRIPIAALTGTNGKTTTARMLAHILKLAGHTPGMTSTDAVYVNGQLTVKGDMTGPTAANIVLRDPTVDIAVLETARGGMLRAGLGYDYCEVGAVLNVSSDHLGLGGVETLDQLAEVKRLIVEVAKDTAVLNADNPYTLAMADHSPAKHIFYVTRNPQHALVKEHIRAGCRAMVLESGANGDMITLYDKGQHIPLIWTHLLPSTLEGRALHNVENAMFAAAMAYALGKSLDDIRQGLRTFDTTFFQAPGRMNIYDKHPFKVILDYGHNQAAVRAMVELVERLAPKGRKIVIATCPGDRRNQDIEAIAEEIAGKFDVYICDRDDGLRDRGPTEVPELMQAALLKLGVKPEQIEMVPEEEKAVQRALEIAQVGDLLLLFIENITRSWKQVIYFNKPPADAVEADKPRRDPTASEIILPEGMTLIRDHRGVRLTAKGS